MKKHAHILLILLSLLSGIGSYSSFAQGARINKNRIGLIIGGGASFYQGDLTSRFQDLTPNANICLGVTYRMNGSFSLRSEANLFQLNGTNTSKNNNASFKSTNGEVAVSLVYDIMKLSRSYVYRSEYTPYFFIGAGIAGFNTNSSEHSINRNNSGYAPIIPMGMGVRIKAAKFLDVAIEAGFRKTFTDKLDNMWEGAGEKNLSFQELTNQSGDGVKRNENTDNYFFTQVKLIYSPTKFAKKKVQKVRGLSSGELRKIRAVSLDISRSKKLRTSRQ